MWPEHRTSYDSTKPVPQLINGISIHHGETIPEPASGNVLYIFGNASFLTATIG